MKEQETNPEIGFHGHMALLHHAVLESHAIEQLQRSHAQPVRFTREYFRRALVDDSGPNTTACHPICSHESRGTGADDEPEK